MNRELIGKAVALLVSYREYTGDCRIANVCGEIVEALKAQLAKPEQEPVAWMVLTLDNKKLMLFGEEKPPIFDAPVKLIPLYTAPPRKEWVGLTDEEIISSSKFFDYMTNEELIDAVRELETKLKDKNNG